MWGWAKRYGSWVRGTADKVIHHAGRGVDVGSDAWKATGNIRQPRRFSKRAFFGTEPDGGIARFRRYSEGLSQQEIEQAADAWDRDRSIYFIGAVISVVLMPVSIVYGQYSFYTIIGLLFLSAFLVARGVKADFRYWQIRQGRFGPLADYLNGRLPINMQIIDKDK